MNQVARIYQSHFPSDNQDQQDKNFQAELLDIGDAVMKDAAFELKKKLSDESFVARLKKKFGASFSEKMDVLKNKVNFSIVNGAIHNTWSWAKKQSFRSAWLNEYYKSLRPLSQEFITKTRARFPARFRFLVWSHFGKVKSPTPEHLELYQNLDTSASTNAYAFVFEIFVMLKMLLPQMTEYEHYVFNYMKIHLEKYIPTLEMKNHVEDLEWQTYASKMLDLLERYALQAEMILSTPNHDVEGAITSIFAPPLVKKAEEVPVLSETGSDSLTSQYGLGDGDQFVNELTPLLEEYIRLQMMGGKMTLRCKSGPALFLANETLRVDPSDEGAKSFNIFFHENLKMRVPGARHEDVRLGAPLFERSSDVVDEGEKFSSSENSLQVNNIRVKTMSRDDFARLQSQNPIKKLKLIPIQINQKVSHAIELARKSDAQTDIRPDAFKDSEYFFEVMLRNNHMVFKNERQSHALPNPLASPELDHNKIVTMQIDGKEITFKNEILRPLSIPQHVINFLYAPWNDFRSEEQKTKRDPLHPHPEQKFLFVERPGMGKTTMALLVFKRHWKESKPASQQTYMLFAGPNVAIGSNFKREFASESENLGLNSSAYAGMMNHIKTLDFRDRRQIDACMNEMKKTNGKAVVVIDEAHNADVEDALCVNSIGASYAPIKLNAIYFFLKLTGYDIETPQQIQSNIPAEKRKSKGEIVDVTKFIDGAKRVAPPANVIAIMTATPMSSKSDDPGRFLSKKQKEKKFAVNGKPSSKTVVETFSPVGAFLLNVCSGGELLDPNSSKLFDPKGICTYTYALANVDAFTKIAPLTRLLQKNEDGSFKGRSLDEWNPQDMEELASLIKLPVDQNGLSERQMPKAHKDLSTVAVFESKIGNDLKKIKQGAKAPAARAEAADEDQSDDDDPKFMIPDSCKHLGLIAKPMEGAHVNSRGSYGAKVEIDPYMYSPKLAATAHCMCKTHNSFASDTKARKQLVLLEQKHGFWLFMHVLKSICSREMEACKSYSYPQVDESKGQDVDAPSTYAAKMMIAFRMQLLELPYIGGEAKDHIHNCKSALSARAVALFDAMYNKQLFFYDENHVSQLQKGCERVPLQLAKFRKDKSDLKGTDAFYPQTREFLYMEATVDALERDSDSFLVNRCNEKQFPEEKAAVIKINRKGGKVVSIEVLRKEELAKITIGNPEDLRRGKGEGGSKFDGDSECKRLGKKPCDPSQATICTFLTDSPSSQVVDRRNATKEDPRGEFACFHGCEVKKTQLGPNDVIALFDMDENKFVRAMFNKRPIHVECCWGMFEASNFQEGASAFGTEYIYLTSTPSSGRNGLQRIFRGVRFCKISRSRKMKIILFEITDKRDEKNSSGHLKLCDTQALDMLHKDLPNVLNETLMRFRELGIDFRLKTSLEEAIDALDNTANDSVIVDQSYSIDNPFASYESAVSSASLEAVKNWLENVAVQCEEQREIVAQKTSMCSTMATLEQCSKHNLFCDFNNRACRSKMDNTICNGIRDHMPLFLQWTTQLNTSVVLDGMLSGAITEIIEFLTEKCSRRENVRSGLGVVQIPLLDMDQLMTHQSELKKLFERAEKHLMELNEFYKDLPLISEDIFEKVPMQDHIRVLCVSMVIAMWAFERVKEEVTTIKGMLLYFPIMTSQLCNAAFGMGRSRYRHAAMNWFAKNFSNMLGRNLEKSVVELSDPNFYFENVQYETVTHPLIFWSGFLGYILFSMVCRKAIEAARRKQTLTSEVEQKRKEKLAKMNQRESSPSNFP